MKSLIVLAAIVVAVMGEDLYDSNNDNVDIEGIVSDPEKLQAFMNCFLDRSPCDEVAADFKKDLPEVTELACAKCTTAQKHILRKFLEASKQKISEDYGALKNKLDPENKYFGALEKAIENA